MDWNTIIVAAISFLGTLVGTLGGILAAQKLVNYRLQQLEVKVDKHNSVIERTFKLEEDAKHFHEELADIKEEIRILKTT